MFCKSRNHFEPEGTLWVQHHLEAPVCNIICAFPNIWQQNDSYWKHMLYCFVFISKLVNNGAQITYFCLMLPVISGLCDDKWQHWLGVCVWRARACVGGISLVRCAADSSAFNGQNKFAARWFCECFAVMEPRKRKHCSPSALWCVFVLWTQLQLTLTQGKSFKPSLSSELATFVGVFVCR